MICAVVEVKAPLELVVYRQAAPWAGGTPLPLNPAGTANGRSGGSRAAPRRGSFAGRVVPQATDRYPTVGPDVADVPMPWNADLEDPQTRAISRVLLQREATADGLVTSAGAARALEVLGSAKSLDHPISEALCRLLRDDAPTSIQGVLMARSPTPDLTYALVRSGLTAAAVQALDWEADAEALSHAHHSPRSSRPRDASSSAGGRASWTRSLSTTVSTGVPSRTSAPTPRSPLHVTRPRHHPQVLA